MTTITSPHNPRLQELRRLQRRRERTRSGRFLAEGEDLLAAAADARWKPVEGYRVAGSELGGSGFLDVEPAALAAVSTLGSGTRAIGVYEQRWSPRPLGPLCVYLHGLSDPGNVGTVLRAAHAFGASCVALGPGCADPWSPKAVRASMGAIFHVALARAGRSQSCRRSASRWCPTEAHPPSRCAGRRRARSRCWWAPSARACRRSCRRVRARCVHPDRQRLAERGDGGDHRVAMR